MGRAPLSDAEWKVMNAVWTERGDVSARTVHEAIAADTGWAYTTVKTLMDRLVDKGVLDATLRRHVSFYRSKLPRRRAVAAAARRLADRAFGGQVAPLVHHLIQSKQLTDRDRNELRRLLDESAAGSASTSKDDDA